MEVEGVYYIAQVKKKEKAWRMYQEAVQKNQTAGHIDVEVRMDNKTDDDYDDDLAGET